VTSARALSGFLVAFGAAHLLLGLLMAAAPGTFFEEIGPYPPQNDHYIRDLSTFYLALGGATLVAWRRASWRVPVIGLALIQYALHTLNHLVDVGEAEREALGPVNLALIGLTALALGWALRTALEEHRR
jgi:peptidoglycan/LPS O-acetylase OafA/YrhL